MSFQLPNGCHIGKMSVHPKNWEEPGADLSIEWYIHYRFHDPRYKDKWPKGYLAKARGMNDIKSLAERRRITRGLLENEKNNLQQGYSPILGKIVSSNDLEISPSTGLTAALEKAFRLLPDSITKEKMEKALVHIYKAGRQLGYENLPVSSIRQHHLEILLLQIGRTKEEEYKQLRERPVKSNNKVKKTTRPKKAIPDKWGPEAFNSYRAYLQILFKQLKKVGASEVKPVDDIEKKKGIKKLRVGISEDVFQQINTFLRPNYYTFWRVIHMFFPSGARETEFMGVQKEHVELANQRFRVLVKKGKGMWEWKWKTITRAALPLWREVLQEAKASGDFLFSEDLRPGPVRISARQLTIRWRRHVKEKLGITADFYELKHSFTTKVINMALKKIDEATKVAADINDHTSNVMNRTVYDLEAGERLHRELKDLG